MYILFIDALFIIQENQSSSTDVVQVVQAAAGPSGLQLIKYFVVHRNSVTIFYFIYCVCVCVCVEGGGDQG